MPRLTYTAHNMAPFARDFGYDDPPFIWNPNSAAACAPASPPSYSTFPDCPAKRPPTSLAASPFVRRQDEAEFGLYRARDLILTSMNGLTPGNPETVVEV